MDIKLYVKYDEDIFDITDMCMGKISLFRYRGGRASKLCFKLIKGASDKIGFAFFEGSVVWLTVDGENMFWGYVFSKERTSEQIISVLAYDQMRYLKNRDSYIYTYKTSAQLIKNIASDFELKTGELTDTGFVIKGRLEEDLPIIDIILNSLDLTKKATGRSFEFYDDFGSLTLKELKEMRLELMLSDDLTLIDYNYKTEIDTDTFNKVCLWQRDLRSGFERAVYTEDKESINEHGVLQYRKRVSSDINEAQLEEMAKNILKDKNRAVKSLYVECIGTGNGELKIRGGSGIFVKIDRLGEVSVSQWLTVSECEHIFEENEHRVRLKLERGDYDGAFGYY